MKAGEDRATDPIERVQAEDVRAQVARILNDPSFAVAPQLSRLLTHLVENALTGDRREIKEYALGVELFDRGASFDPRLDNIVRAHARRLRQRLKAYFDEPGRADPVVIEIPKGHYLAVFHSNEKVLSSDGNAASDEPAVPSKAKLNAIAMAIVAAVVLVGAAVGLFFWNRAAPEVATTPSILVLPFENLSDSRDTNYFARGVHEDLLSLLVRIKGLTVIARTTAVSLAATNKSVKEMAAAAGVDRVLEGSIRRTDDRVRLTVQLISASDETHLWAETYDRKVADIFAIGDELVQAIAQQLRIRLDPEFVAEFAKAGTTNMEAYALYLQARASYKENPDGAERRIVNLQRAIELDPNFASAYGLLASAGWASGAPVEVTASIKKNIDRALSLDPENPEGLISMSSWLHKQGRADLAYAYGARAVAAAPGEPVFHLFYGDVSADYRERLRHWEEAYRLDPLGDRAFLYVPRLLTQMRVAEAFEIAQSLVGLANNEGPVDPFTVGSVYIARGDSVAGLRQLRVGSETWPVPLILALSNMGQAVAAARWLDATKPGLEPRALLLLRAGKTEALGDFLAGWLTESPGHPYALHLQAWLQARHADEALDRGDTATQRARLVDALSAFRAAPFTDDGPGFYVDYWQQSLTGR